MTDQALAVLVANGELELTVLPNGDRCYTMTEKGVQAANAVLARTDWLDTQMETLAARLTEDDHE